MFFPYLCPELGCRYHGGLRLLGLLHALLLCGCSLWFRLLCR